MRRTVAVLVVLVALVFAALNPSGRPSVAAGHALLASAEPPVNSMVQTLPSELVLRFSEPLERKFSTATVQDQDGRRLDTAVTFDETDSNAMRVAVEAAAPGYVVVSWETVSSVDGHRITGSYPITILNPDGSVPAAAPPVAVTAQGDEARPGFVVSKFLGLVGGCLLAGALMFMLWVSPRLSPDVRKASDRRGAAVALGAVALVFVAGAIELAVQALDIGSGVGDVLATRWGERWLLRHACYGVALAAVLALLYRRDVSLNTSRAFAAAGLLATSGAFVAISSTSHAAAGPGSFWATLTDIVHLLAASVWTGMLAMLALLFVWARRRPAMPERHAVLSTALQRFSVVAALSVALLIVTGTVSAVVEVGEMQDLIDSAYGRALALKLLLMFPLLAVAGFNAYVLRPAYIDAGAAPAPASESTLSQREARLTSTIRLELVLALTVFAVVGVLVQLTPTRTSAEASSAEPFAATKDAQGLTIALSVVPNLPGINAFDVMLAGSLGPVEQVRLEFLDRSGATSEARLVLTEARPGAYAGQGPFLSRAGDWQVRVNVRQSAGADLSVPFDLQVGRADADGVGAFASPIDWNEGQTALIVLALLLATTILLGSVRSARWRDHRLAAAANPETLSE